MNSPTSPLLPSHPQCRYVAQCRYAVPHIYGVTSDMSLKCGTLLNVASSKPLSTGPDSEDTKYRYYVSSSSSRRSHSIRPSVEWQILAPGTPPILFDRRSNETPWHRGPPATSLGEGNGPGLGRYAV